MLDQGVVCSRLAEIICHPPWKCCILYWTRCSQEFVCIHFHNIFLCHCSRTCPDVPLKCLMRIHQVFEARARQENEEFVLLPR